MTEESSLVLQGGVAATAVAFFQQAVLRMIPFSVPAVALLFLDLIYGMRAAHCRNERVRLSTALRRSITKLWSYVCWLILASTLALAFGQGWLEWTVLGAVYLNELASIVGNYLETKGLEVSWAMVFNTIFKIGGQKFGVDTSDIDASEFVKPKEPKTSRFVKKIDYDKGRNPKGSA